MKRQNTTDRTADQRPAGIGMDTRRLFLCGHKAHAAGSEFRGGVPMQCAACKDWSMYKEPKT